MEHQQGNDPGKHEAWSGSVNLARADPAAAVPPAGAADPREPARAHWA